MELLVTNKILSLKVLNDDTGELENKTFHETKEKKHGARGGFRMVYLDYDQALLQIVKSTKDLEIVIHIRDMFTHARWENVLSKVDLAKDLDVSEQKVSDIIKRMVNTHLLKRVSRGVYRLNPYMYLPFKADAYTLQKEWKELP